MIKLDVCEYCQNCMEFEPCVTARPELLYVDNGPHGFIGDTIVKCNNCSKCEVLYKYLKRSEENKNNG
jgi:hypothetical protein